MNDSTQLTWQQAYKDFKGALSGAADALKTGSEHVYEILIRQQSVNSISLLAVILMLAAASYFAIKFVSSDKMKEGLDDYEVGPVFAMVGTIILVLGTLFFATTHATEIVTGFVNPEYGAIQEIRKFIK